MVKLYYTVYIEGSQQKIAMVWVQGYLHVLPQYTAHMYVYDGSNYNQGHPVGHIYMCNTVFYSMSICSFFSIVIIAE